MTFQRKVATYRYSLFVAIFVGFVVWLLDRHLDNQRLLGVLPCALAVYLISELNNAFALLRISSRMISTVLALLLPMVVFLHPLQPAHAVLLFAVLMYFPLLASYQHNQVPLFSFLTFLMLGCVSLIVPHLLFLMPVIWVMQMLLKAFTFRGLVASIIGVALPLWFAAGYFYLTDHLDVFLEKYMKVMELELPQYEGLSLNHWLTAGFVALLFLIGCVDNAFTRDRDKTRVRNIYLVVMVQGVFAFAGLALLPQFFHELLPLCLIPSSIMIGHFLALSYGRFQNYLTIILLLATLALSINNALLLF